MARFHHLLASLRNTISEVLPAEASVQQADGALLLDVREPHEWNEAHIPGAHHLPRGFLEMRIEAIAPELTQPIICQCAGGNRSLLAAETLRLLGYSHVSSLADGIRGWKEAGLPLVQQPQEVDLTEEERQRYARHLTIPEVGEAGQLKLKKAKVLIIGAGGLGSPAALYLAAAGVGTIGMVDFDCVEASNLQRQILHNARRLGQPKVASAKATLEILNPLVTIETHAIKLTEENAISLLKPYDLIIDGSDNFTARYAINDACVTLRKPFLHGSILRFEGQVGLFEPEKGPCYRCLYPEPPRKGEAPSCAEAGVIGVLPGVMGTLQAIEAIKWILCIGESMRGRLLIYDALKGSFQMLQVSHDAACRCLQEGKNV